MNAGSVRGLSLEALAREMFDLRQRVEALERQITAIPTPAAAALEVPAELPQNVLESGEIGDAMPVLGRALLGMAGAYLLRALTELGTISHIVGVLAGFAYAAGWLYYAARETSHKKLAASIGAITSVAVLGPLLWEASQRLHAISSWKAAMIVTAFTLTAIVLCWNEAGAIVPLIVVPSAALFALVLLVALRDLLPFSIALLVIAGSVEFAAFFDRETSTRPLVALAADLALIVCTYLVASPKGLPEGYVGVSALAILACQLALLTIYVASTAARTLLRNRPFTNFETVQTAAAFLIGLGGAFQLAKTSGTGTMPIGLFALLGGTACYLISFLFVGRGGRRDRSFHTYTIFGILLVLAGTVLLFSGMGLLAAWAAFVVGCLWAGSREQRHVLELHAALMLLLLWIASGVALQPRTQFFGDPAAPVAGWREAVVILTAFLVYAVVLRSAVARPLGGDEQVSAWISAVVATLSTAGILAHGLALLVPELAATSATGVLAMLTVLLAAWGVQWKRVELRWLVFALAGCGAYKLVTEDLHQKYTLALVFSLLMYGAMLMMLPKLLRPERQ